jgi:GH25 family lysozyme M1 (1,4-beta-N-acetylmuramidase)
MIQGVDVSKWQREMTWYKCRDAGARFAYIRAGSCTATGGECYTDDQFERNAQIAPEYLPVGFYWYLRPYHDVLKQADYFCYLIRNKNWKLPPVADCEIFTGLTAEQSTTAVIKFVREIYRLLGYWPMIYTRAGLWNDSTLADELFKELDLWIARYTTKAYPWGNPGESEKLKPRDWDTWRLWQYSADGNGKGREYGAQSDAIDLNYFNGDETDFLLWSGQTVTNLVKVKKPAAAVYAGPDGMILGTTWRGRTWKVNGKDESGEWLKVEAWLRNNDINTV